MLRPGQSLRTERGHRVEIRGVLGSGNQGEVFRAQGEAGEPLALKVFLEPREDLEQRTAFLVRNMRGMGPTVLSPMDRVVSPGFLATLAPFVPGLTLEAWLQESPRAGDLRTRMVMALGLATAVEAFHARNWTPGDLGADQFIVQETSVLSTVRLVDVDSLVAPGLPAPRTLGKLPYFSPEIRTAFLAGKSHPITPQSDLFSLGVLLHELLLLRHPAEGHADPSNPEAYHRTMMEGWPDDPLACRKGSRRQAVGFPVALLDPNTQRILRFALGPDPSGRPSAASIKADLASAFGRMCPCPACAWEIIPFEGQTCCPYPECSASFGVPRFLGSGLALALDRPQMVLGRAELPSPQVSRQHLKTRRVGPCLEIVSVGANGTFLWRDSQWARLPDGKPIMLTRGERIRLGGFELRLVA